MKVKWGYVINDIYDGTARSVDINESTDLKYFPFDSQKECAKALAKIFHGYAKLDILSEIKSVEIVHKGA